MEVEVRLRQPDGGGRWVRVSTQLNYGIDGSVRHALGAVVDIQSLKEAVAERSRALAELERANRAKDEFLATMSHELRTPLNAIVGWSNLLRTGAVESSQVPKALETIERNARIQSRLIEDMLDLARIEQGMLVLSVGPTEIVRVVEAAIDAVRPAADAKGVRLQPVLDSHATVIGDADRLQQVAWNLLSNAIKFTPRGGRVQVRVRREPSYVELVVADDGQGIAADFLPYVFDRFRQADGKISRKAGGLGLGLAIVRAIVQLHGGTVNAQSDGVGAGATFSVQIPMAPLRATSAGSDGDRDRAAAAPTFECPPALSGLHALVVDDEPEARDLLRYVLEQCNTRVSEAAGATEALAQLGLGGIDLLVSDIGMPEIDGYELIRRVRTLGDEGARIPAIALTAYARTEDRTQALRAGFDMHLTKPVEPSELLVVIGTLIDGVRRRVR
jgi:signal transduction histidine kinase